MPNSKLNIGTLNVRGVKQQIQQQTLGRDALSYDIQVLGLSETHLAGEGLEEISVSVNNQQRKYILFYTGSVNKSFHGVGLLVQKDLNPSFKRISDRICYVNIKLSTRWLHVISAYAPTLAVSEKHPEQRDAFYEQLDSTVSNFSKRDLVVVVGDFNAKTGSGKKDYPSNIGQFGKGKLNENGKRLLELANKQDLELANTLFQHKLCHTTIWTAPERANDHRSWDGTIRRNPYRNQIDYILCKNEHRFLLSDARSYGGINISTDHKLVKAIFNLKWYRLPKAPKNEVINVANFTDSNTRLQYLAETK